MDAEHKEAVPADMGADFVLVMPDERLAFDGIHTGDRVYISKDAPQDGELAVVELDGEHYVGHLWRMDGLLTIAHGGGYASAIFHGPQVARARVIGTVVGWEHRVHRRAAVPNGSGEEGQP